MSQRLPSPCSISHHPASSAITLHHLHQTRCTPTCFVMTALASFSRRPSLLTPVLECCLCNAGLPVSCPRRKQPPPFSPLALSNARNFIIALLLSREAGQAAAAAQAEVSRDSEHRAMSTEGEWSAEERGGGSNAGAAETGGERRNGGWRGELCYREQRGDVMGGGRPKRARRVEGAGRGVEVWIERTGHA